MIMHLRKDWLYCMNKRINMKEYFKVLKEIFIELMIGLLFSVVVILYIIGSVYLLDKSAWLLIPIVIVTILLSSLAYSKLLDKSMENFTCYILFGFGIVSIVIIALLAIVGILFLLRFLLRISFWFIIPMLIVGFLLYTYAKYREKYNK